MVEKTATLIQNARDQEVDTMLSELGVGFKLAVRRNAPQWCDGNLGTIDIDPDQPINAEDIRQRYGGRRLTLKILRPNGEIMATKALSFPDPPRQDGVELIQGPDGLPTTREKLDEQRQIQKQENIGFVRNMPGDQSMALLQTLLMAQNEQAAATRDMLAQRVAHLETLLESRAQAQIQAPIRSESLSAFDSVRETVKMIKDLEQLKVVVGATTGAVVNSGSEWSAAIDKLLDFALESMRAKMINAQPQAKTPPPALPRAPVQQKLSNADLILEIKERWPTLDDQTKDTMIKEVLGDELEVDDKDENDLKNEPCTDSDQSVKLDLLSEKDRALLGNEDNGDSDS